MLAYIFIIFFMVFLRLFIFNRWEMKDKERAWFIVLALIPITIVSGFRGIQVGADTITYNDIFLEVTNGGEFDERIEIGFVHLNRLLALMTSEFQWLLILTAVFLSISIGVFIYKNAKDPFLALLFFVTLGLFQFSLSGIRQTIAISIAILSMELIKNRKLWRFLVVISLAFLFHKSAVLFVPAYFIANKNITTKNLIIYLVAFLTIFLSADFFFLTAADLMELNYGVEETNNGYFFFSIVLIITVLGFRNRKNIIYSNINNIKETNKSNIMFLNLNFISLLLWAVRLISRTAERVTFYYMPSTYLLLEEYVSSIKRKKTRLMVYFLVCLLSVALFFYRISGDETITPYIFF